jgi:predicted nucleotidyltransferase
VSVTFFRLDKSKIEQNLKVYAHQLAEDPQVLAVVLFGSLARGEATASSDADVLIVLQDSPKLFTNAARIIYDAALGLAWTFFPIRSGRPLQPCARAGGL